MTSTLASSSLPGALAQAAELPVRQVVLYKHGVGFFARGGKLAAGEAARLDFRASEMNDVLKSLTISVPAGGTVAGLRYDSADPLSHKLEDFPFQLGEAQPLSAILDRLKGAQIELQFGNDWMAGQVVNGRLIAGSDKQPEREQLTLLTAAGDLRNVDLSAAAVVRFADPKLQAQFKEYLAVVAAARSKEKRSVYIHADGSRERELSASYTIPAAVWKSSYRLIFGGNGAPTIEGWAMVDNTTGGDWTGVQLSLASGRPISFVSWLYAPRYVRRPVAELPDESAASPVMHAGEYDYKKPGQGALAASLRQPQEPVPASASMARRPANALGREATVPVDAGISGYRVAPSSIVAAAAAQEMGELFEYRIAGPVTIRRDESAMLPFLQQQIEARKLLIYSQGAASEHPTQEQYVDAQPSRRT